MKQPLYQAKSLKTREVAREHREAPQDFAHLGKARHNSAMKGTRSNHSDCGVARHAFGQMVDGHWFPADTRVDDTLHFQVQAIHMPEIVKFSGYKRSGAVTAAKPKSAKREIQLLLEREFQMWCTADYG